MSLDHSQAFRRVYRPFYPGQKPGDSYHKAKEQLIVVYVYGVRMGQYAPGHKSLTDGFWNVDGATMRRVFKGQALDLLKDP